MQVFHLVFESFCVISGVEHSTKCSGPLLLKKKITIPSASYLDLFLGTNWWKKVIRYFSLSHSFFLSLFLSFFLSHTHTHTLSFFHSLTHSLSFIHTLFTHSLSFFHSSFFHSLSFFLSLTLFLSLSFFHSLSFAPLIIFSSHDPQQCHIGFGCCHEETKEIQGPVNISFDLSHNPEASFGVFNMSYILAHRSVLAVIDEEEITREANNSSLIVVFKKRKTTASTSS